jgi:glycine/D-amino acid oxidase-like deaminating enzyme
MDGRKVHRPPAHLQQIEENLATRLSPPERLIAPATNQDLADKIGGSWVHVDGGMHWAYSEAPQHVDRLRDTVRRLEGGDFALIERHRRSPLREIEPDVWIDPDQVPEVYLTPREGWIETVPMAHGVLTAARTRYAAQLELGTVVGIELRHGAVEGLVLGDGRRLPADVIVNTSGPDAGAVSALAGVTLPLSRQPGFMVVSEPAPVSLRRVLRSPRIHVRPDGNGRLLLHEETLDSFVTATDMPVADSALAQRTLETARSVIAGLRGVGVEAVRLGVRSMPDDGHPIVGFQPEVSGLYTVVTHSGVTLSARLALLVTEDLITGDVAELAPYRPTRFASTAAV